MPKQSGSGPQVAGGKRGKTRQVEQRVCQPDAAGCDIGAREIFVAVPADRDEHPVRKCGTFTGELREMAEWLVGCGIKTVAMESTGVYWIPVYDVFEKQGLEVRLVNPRQMKNVPGKRTDFHECQWIQYLHAMGLLAGAFRPASDVRAVRTLMRHRSDLVEMASQHVQHMQKALTQMNVQFQHVISDITGLTGLAILDAIVDGERDPAVLARLRDPRVKASEETLRQSLEGNWCPAQILVLTQRLSLYRSHREQIDACDKEIEKLLTQFAPLADPEQKPMPEDRKQKQRKRKKKTGNPGFNMREEAYKLFGVDLTQIPGLMALVFLLFSEVGRDMSRWPTAAHFVSWLGLCPDNDISGGKVLWRGNRRVKNRAGTLFRLAAHSLHRDQTPMGDYLRRMKAKLGPAAATTATAHKIAIIFYTMVKKQVEYDATLWAQRDLLREKRIEAKLHRQAAERGYKLVPVEAAA
jgi:transposase